MPPNVLLTGVSGYLGGQIAADIAKPTSSLPAHGTIFALVRSDAQAEAVKRYGLQPLTLALDDEAAVVQAMVDHQISIVFWLINAVDSVTPGYFIKGLAKVRETSGLTPHFLHTTGAKLFSSLSGLPADRPLLDTEADLYDMTRTAEPPFPLLAPGLTANTTVVDLGERFDVRTYIVAPCMVYGESEGFGNKISIQTTFTVKAAKAAGSVYNFSPERPSWPVCHITDTSSLYLILFGHMLSGNDIGHGRQGYYLASSGVAAWEDFYKAVAESLHRRGLIATDQLTMIDDGALGGLANRLETLKDFVVISLSGKCTYTAQHGAEIGWKCKYGPEHFLESADAEVDLILKHL